MSLNIASAAPSFGDALIMGSRGRWGVDSEYGRLHDVLLSPPPHLEMLPVNAMTVEAIEQGLSTSVELADRQHAELVTALEGWSVRCHIVPPSPYLPDLSFTRDATLMTPWGLLELAPAVAHRQAEVAAVAETARALGVPLLGKIEEGHVEGGDILLLRPGVIAIGWSGERTDERGARALADIFGQRGWRAILYKLHPRHLHLDALLTLVDRNRAVAVTEALDPSFLQELDRLGIDLIPVTFAEGRRLGANLVTAGEKRLLSPADNDRVNGELERLGYEVARIEVDQFTRCGGGIHCLTLPLARDSG